MPSNSVRGKRVEYYGDYIGHGQSKTAFVLDRRDAKFHDKVLKVNNTEDMEPTIFTKASEHNLTTSIYYNCGGVDTTANREKIANAAYVTYYWETGKDIYTKQAPTRDNLAWVRGELAKQDASN